MDENLKEKLLQVINEVENDVEVEEEIVETFEPKKIFEIQAIDIEVTKTYIPFIKGAYNLLTGRGGVGKSLVALLTMVEYLVNNPTEQAIAFFSEDFKVEVDDRLKASCVLLGADYNDIAFRCNFMCVDNDDRIPWAFKKKGNLEPQIEYLDSFETFCKENDVGFIILDPLNRFHRLEENSNDEMGWFAKNIINAIANRTGAVVIVIHHSSKDVENTGGRSRGAGTITDSARLAYNIEATKVTGVVLLNVIKDNMRVSRDCKILTEDQGIFNLPDTDTASEIDVEVTEYNMNEV